MRVVVVGAGLIGLTAAYALSSRGHEVTVLERRVGPGEETSFANGGLLTAGMAEPWNAPGCWRTLLSSLGRSDAPLQLRWRALPALVGWGIGFLHNSSVATFERNAHSNRQLALYSLRIMESWRRNAEIEYGRAACGSLKIFRGMAALDKAHGDLIRSGVGGLHVRRLSRQQLIEFEPALRPVAEQLAGGIHYIADESGDAYRFCVQIVEQAQSLGARFRFGTQVTSFEIRAGQVLAVRSGHERFVADRYIVAAGSYSPQLLRRIGIHLPVRPAKGYSITIEPQCEQRTLTLPIIDDQLHAVIVPLGRALRVAGTAEFAGYDLTLTQSRIRNLLAFIRQVLPRMQFDSSEVRPWCGLRPMSIDGVPIVGATQVANLFVSTGHGHLGWTTAAGSADLLADLLCGYPPSIDPAPYAHTRFALA